MAKKDFSKQISKFDELESTTNKLIKNNEESNESYTKICLRIPRSILYRLKEKKLAAEKEGEKTSIQDEVIKALTKYLK